MISPNWKKLDPSFWSLLLANLITILLAVRFHWSLLELMWIYWAQSVTIGFFNYLKMARINKEEATFFAMHYGFFHFLYAVFLLAFTLAPEAPFHGPNPIYWPAVFGTALMFFGNHAFSYSYNWEKESPQWDAGQLMVFPYARIFPMHLTLILGGLSEAFFAGSPWLVTYFPIFLFLGLKTAADLIMHLIEHRSGAKD